MRKFLFLLGLFLQGGGQPINIPVTEAGWQFSHANGGGAGPYGTNGCYAGYVGTCTQDLGQMPKQGIYTITFSVQNQFYSYPAHYTAKLSYGTQELCPASNWPLGDFTQVTIVCTSPGYLIVDHQLPSSGPPQGSHNLMLSFTVDYWEGQADNFSVTFTPTS